MRSGNGKWQRVQHSWRLACAPVSLFFFLLFCCHAHAHAHVHAYGPFGIHVSHSQRFAGARVSLALSFSVSLKTKSTPERGTFLARKSIVNEANIQLTLTAAATRAASSKQRLRYVASPCVHSPLIMWEGTSEYCADSRGSVSERGGSCGVGAQFHFMRFDSIPFSISFYTLWLVCIIVCGLLTSSHSAPSLHLSHSRSLLHLSILQILSVAIYE